MVKLTDVAKLAGVSATTVSRVINNYGSLSQHTKDKVFAAMQELNYQPNSLARSLQGKETKLIGVIFPSVSNPFFGELVSLLESHLFAKGYKVILCNSAENKEKERAYLQMLIANQVDGIIAGAHNLGIAEYERVGLPIISFDRALSNTIPIVSSDNYTGGALATEALLKAGAKKIVILSGINQPNSPTTERLNGYADTLKAADLQPITAEIDFHTAANIKALKIHQLLVDQKPDGVFCTDDLSALLLINEAQKLGLAIPTDLQVVGYDGTKLIQDYHPELTTIMQPIDDIATLLIDLLLQRIKDHHVALQPRYQLPVKLINGQTTR
ncbi:LacI family DNA-binding transcriptional regulator [Loigolactobacillus coryniformis]|jgi:LacI family sucrose operon transcriptional repressor|uniref:LacI family transcription regulator n=3 Tax=Loigolactobacillus coryniformis TaxID=1610 RepID=A0A0R1F697_9LACO|nr:LacI family DNA-binding transcriptional regulator [Loigolactobacillus coryniformis]MDT3392719.1 LacI family DNA-binding transcriptional regulator [Bacillota bacterium]ATO44280.1 LacI family transcriptional regulator [Loigolactobacillus coryniformis subsp. torquens DSM 20004 = KCTC 3535]ATO55967.1 LacI family transcriptional regulator [Loigolactobacillus coryniformis subsp. coryniformis KCTC 3167 = DSM 20001]KRK14602.1 LacI family transcription regulator [Loigolactobacillus coryniformis subsp